MSKLLQELLLELDNGPQGRVKTDDIKFGKARNLSGYTVDKDELKKRRAEKTAALKASRDAFKKLENERNKAWRDEEKRHSQPDLKAIAKIIEDAVSQSGMDADPIDWIVPKMNRLGYDGYEIGQLLDKAMQKVGIMGQKYKSYSDYLADMWDSYIEATYEPPKRGTWGRDKHSEPPQNPWR